ncbi:Conserved oligomeric Golgi complex subunit 6 [Frankliniella fusca]|uniref:Conserved oligomeric Golgi complex subunit 6 n=1 Tax=Frankliniella fusca TaxID=407009 RepID=A0AAE1I4P0_9NEOP|nr:Conserved oligomeric Golgi complex subunit 6 [Frankliniella fusca]
MSLPASSAASHLQEPGDSGGQSDVLCKRLNKIFETRLDTDKETLEALKELSTFFTENSIQSRRNLRSKIEKRSLAINEEFLSAFTKVKDALDTVYNDVVSIDSEVRGMNMHLQATRAQTYQLIEHTTQLQAQRKKLSMEHDVACAFLERYQLSPTELTVLHGSTRDSPITSEFFSALQHAQTIHADCRTLMQSGFQTVALDIMEQMSLHQEAALERLYRWTQSHCRSMESNETAALLTEAMSCLQERPVLFKYVLDEYGSCRRATLVRAFIDALTKGGPGGTLKPIEMHASDPKRYIGDMLAWLHQVIPSEKESLRTLMSACSKIDVSDHIQQILASITEGICHPLKVRVDRILSTDATTTILYSVASLLGYYHQIFSQVSVVPESVLLSTLAELRTLAQNRFISALQGRVKQHLADRLDTPPPDLSPSTSVSALLSLLKEVLSVAGVADGRPEDIAKMVGVVLDPLLQAVNLSASRLPTTDMAVYLLNCLYQMQTTLSLYGFMDDRLERLQAQSDAQLDTLTSEQASSLVANLNLGPIYTILQETTRGPLANVPGMDAASLKHFLVKLDGFLSLPDILLMPQISLLLSTNHRNNVKQRAFEVICTIFKQLYAAVNDPGNGYQNPSALISRTPEQVHELLLGNGV